MEHQRFLETEYARLALTLHYPPSEKREDTYPLIVICHGFTGNRIGVDRLFVQAARSLSADGFLVVRFDYGGCGESTGDYGTGGMDRLVEETRSVLDYALRLEGVDLSRVTLLGHSLGGAAAVLTAAADKRVKRLVLWAPVAHPLADITRIIGPRAQRQALTHGETEYLGYALTERFIRSLSDAHPLQEARSIRGDVLVIHGSADEVIPSESAFLYQKAFWLRNDGSSDKEILLQADHSFTGTGVREQLFDATSAWLRRVDPRSAEWNHWII
ncbi:alpha/beta hydrolase family protein [Gorillibacterium sp. sgz5001074]|uniref:alpha/beta hydrolase family protein n=1 Tax=Gorillibacterium sp. sgz5001074 TaxID=3446695 RepID=UPI003F66AC0F